MDAVEEWSDAYERVRELVAGLDTELAGRTVPACPDWSVRDLLAHMIGLDADIVAGDEPDDHNSEWTQRQVDARADVDIAGLLAEWQTIADPLRAWMRANTGRPLGDIVIHEQDLRGALGKSGGQDTDGLHAIRDRMRDTFAKSVAEQPPIALIGDDESGWGWCSSGSADDAAVVVRAPAFDLARALMSRRSASQLRGWTVAGDVESYLSAFGTLGPLPQRDLSE
jgi:uncharacterized protein (TIGR03083 family)